MRTVKSEDNQLVHDSVARFTEAVVVPHLEDLNHYPDHPLPPELLEGLAHLGLFELLLQTEMGGGGGHVETLSIALEALSEKAAAPSGILFAHSFAQYAVLHSGNAKAVQRLARDKSEDKPVILAYPVYSEPGESGAGVRASVKGKSLILNGRLEFIVNAPIATLLLVPATDQESGQISLVLVDANAKGVRIGEALLTLGLRGCPSADVEFANASVTLSSLVAGPGKATGLLLDTVRRFRGPAAAIAAGVVACSIHRARTYAEERYQGGSSIIDYQQVRAMLADMLSDYAACCDAADRLSNGTRFTETSSALLFIRAKEGASRATIDGVQLLGGYGYMEDYGQERCMRDAKQVQCLLGRCDPLRQDLMNDWLGREGAL